MRAPPLEGLTFEDLALSPAVVAGQLEGAAIVEVEHDAWG
jgi:hypothetical protein